MRDRPSGNRQVIVPRGKRAAAWPGLALGLVAAPALAGDVWLPGVGGFASVPAESVLERKFGEVVRQQFDFSCGSAALATLLTYHYEDPTDEMKAFDYMYEQGDKEQISRAGFSLLDMKKYLESHGYDADGYEASLEALAGASVPAIALIDHEGYKHFVVVKGLRAEGVLVGDPALGIRMIPTGEFERMRENGVLFIIKNRADVGKRHFNTDKAWERIARAPLGDALSRQSLADLTVDLPLLGEF